VRSKHDPGDCLADILENIARIDGYVRGLDRRAFGADGRRRDAAERCLERICEAATRLGDTAATMMPDQPRSDIRGMGNRLRHAYDRVGLEFVWDTVRDDLPTLKSDIERALEKLRAEQTKGKTR